MFIDFNTDKLFGNKTNTMQIAKARLLNSKYPLERKTYIQAAADHARQHNLLERLQTLMDTNERDDALIEKLDHIIGECCDNGEKKCRKTQPEWWTFES
jgi:chorismate mutase